MKKILASAAAGVLAAGLVATPAQAAVGDCTNFAGTICLFANSNYGLPIWRQTPAQVNSHPGCRSLVGSGFNNTTTTVVNNTHNYTFLLWSEPNCTGGPIEALPGHTYHLGTTAWNDQISGISKRFA